MTQVAAYLIQQDRVIYARRFLMWLVIASIVMMFAGFTSAYIVKQSDKAAWVNFPLPVNFYYSTLFILLSSGSLFMATRFFKKSRLGMYRIFLGLALILGTLFLGSQYLGWQAMQSNGFLLRTEVSAAFVFVISGFHAIHV